jgi:hypothetical protein
MEHQTSAADYLYCLRNFAEEGRSEAVVAGCPMHGKAHTSPAMPRSARRSAFGELSMAQHPKAAQIVRHTSAVYSAQRLHYVHPVGKVMFAGRSVLRKMVRLPQQTLGSVWRAQDVLPDGLGVY